MSAVANPIRQHTITALVQNETGTLNRLVSLFRRRGFSLSSLNAGDCEQPGFSRLTLIVEADDKDLYQCLRQLEKLLDVVEVSDLRAEQAVERELALIKVQPKSEDRPMVHSVAASLGARVPRVSEDSIVVEISASPAEIGRLVEALQPYNVTEIVRSGLVAMGV